MDMVARRFEVFLVNLDPTIGYEIKKTRPCLVISPDEMNSHIRTVIIAPMTTVGRNYPTRVNTVSQDKEGQVVLDQIRMVDKNRLIKRLGQIDDLTAHKVLGILSKIFAP